MKYEGVVQLPDKRIGVFNNVGSALFLSLQDWGVATRDIDAFRRGKTRNQMMDIAFGVGLLLGALSGFVIGLVL